MKRTLSTCLFLILTANLWSQDESRTEYNFLRLPVSAHAAALGGDNITIPDDDLMMMFQNPSLIIGATPKTVGLQYMNYMSGCHNASAAFNMVFKEKWNVGIGVQYMGYGSMQYRDEHNNDLGTFSATDIALSGVLGYELMENLAGGIAAKWYMEISLHTHHSPLPSTLD